jgi:uncharacterized Zn finger protein
MFRLTLNGNHVRELKITVEGKYNAVVQGLNAYAARCTL